MSALSATSQLPAAAPSLSLSLYLSLSLSTLFSVAHQLDLLPVSDSPVHCAMPACCAPSVFPLTFQPLLHLPDLR